MFEMAFAAKKHYHHGNLRAVLIAAGLELIAEKGVPALTLREIGARVGVSRMAAYRHFADKAELLAAIRAAGFEKFAAALEEGRGTPAQEFSKRLNGMGVAYVCFAREHAAYFEVMFGAPPAGEPQEPCKAEQRAFEILEETIVEGQTNGLLRAGDTRLIACALWSMVHGISALKLDQMPFAGEMEPSAFVVACCNLLLNGVQPAKK
jgi:AcrR family transcriptional regulator